MSEWAPLWTAVGLAALYLIALGAVVDYVQLYGPRPATQRLHPELRAEDPADPPGVLRFHAEKNYRIVGNASGLPWARIVVHNCHDGPHEGAMLVGDLLLACSRPPAFVFLPVQP